jgi:Arc/MetJ-type ribon-helix-helix transcriptional regulator
MSVEVEYRKRSVSLPTSVIDDVQERVGPGQFSAYVAEAVRRQLRRDALAEILADMEAEHGPADEAEVAALMESLGQ